MEEELPDGLPIVRFRISAQEKRVRQPVEPEVEQAVRLGGRGLVQKGLPRRPVSPHPPDKQLLPQAAAKRQGLAMVLPRRMGHRGDKIVQQSHVNVIGKGEEE